MKKQEDQKKLVFDAIFAKATTTVDGGWRLSFDVSQDEAENIAKLARLTSQALKLVVIADSIG